jgi:SecD/SecF fusion protein
VDATISDDIKTSAVDRSWLSPCSSSSSMWPCASATGSSAWPVSQSLTHDALFVLGLYSMLYKIMPFSLEIDEAFIAAILTVIGYSINDTVVVFDRIREYMLDHKRDPNERCSTRPSTPPWAVP